MVSEGWFPWFGAVYQRLCHFLKGVQSAAVDIYIGRRSALVGPLRENVARQREEIGELEALLNRLSAEHHLSEKELKELRSQRDAAVRAVETLEGELKDTQGALQALWDQYNNQETELDASRAQTDGYQKKAEGIEATLAEERARYGAETTRLNGEVQRATEEGEAALADTQRLKNLLHEKETEHTGEWAALHRRLSETKQWMERYAFYASLEYNELVYIKYAAEHEGWDSFLRNVFNTSQEALLNPGEGTVYGTELRAIRRILLYEREEGVSLAEVGRRARALVWR